MRQEALPVKLQAFISSFITVIIREYSQTGNRFINLKYCIWDMKL
jgi:hypothetical protein